ncbi:MAG: acyltransferase [Candidatus Competibacteraceae bacterium]
MRADASNSMSIRIESLDGLRGVAILFVLIWHYFNNLVVPEPNTLIGFFHLLSKMMWSGVDLFFVLSGFLIGRILLINIDSLNYYSTFYIRRFYRIFPLYYILITIFLILSFFQSEANLVRYIPFYLYLNNYSYFVSYNDSFEAVSLSVAWSLAVEEQFYLFVPLLVRVAHKHLGVTLVVIVFSGPLLRAFSEYPYSYTWMPARTDSLILGVFMAYVCSKNGSRDFLCKYMRPACVVIISLVAYLWLLLNQSSIGGVANHFVLSLIYASIILLVMFHSSSFFTRALGTKSLIWIGRRSYAIYLFHMFFLASFGLWAGDVHVLGLELWQKLTIVCASTIVTLIVADILFRYVETPLIARGHRYRYK